MSVARYKPCRYHTGDLAHMLSRSKNHEKVADTICAKKRLTDVFISTYDVMLTEDEKHFLCVCVQHTVGQAFTETAGVHLCFFRLAGMRDLG